MPRLQKTTAVEKYDFETLLLEITHKAKGGLSIAGFVKDEKTDLAIELLFSDEERLAALTDDLSEALLLVSVAKERQKEST